MKPRHRLKLVAASFVALGVASAAVAAPVPPVNEALLRDVVKTLSADVRIRL